MDFKYLCRTCQRKSVFKDGSPGCNKFKIKIDLEKDFCSWHLNESTPICIFCGETEGLMAVYLNNSWYHICQDHYKILYTCQGCAHINTCNFKNDHSKQQYVMRQVRQGNMIMNQQVKNPDLVTKHCSTCHCSFDKDNTCFKEVSPNEAGCPNWQLRTELLQ